MARRVISRAVFRIPLERWVVDGLGCGSGSFRMFPTNSVSYLCSSTLLWNTCDAEFHVKRYRLEVQRNIFCIRLSKYPQLWNSDYQGVKKAANKHTFWNILFAQHGLCCTCLKWYVSFFKTQESWQSSWNLFVFGIWTSMPRSILIEKHLGLSQLYKIHWS